MSEPSNLFVCLLGIGTVFIGLICLILLCKIVGLLTNKKTAVSETSSATAVSAIPATKVSQTIENRQEIIAAVSAAIAEELGTDISALRILSFKKN